jgi:hypothetical protein
VTTRCCCTCGITLVPRTGSIHADMGTWWDHPWRPSLIGHTTTHLDPSPALRADLAAQTADPTPHREGPTS